MSINDKIRFDIFDESTSEKIKEINFYKASKQRFEEALSNGKEEVLGFYKNSGLKLMYEAIMEIDVVRENTVGLFIENSTLASTLDAGELAAFTLAWEKEGFFKKENSIIENIGKNLKGLIEILQKEKLAIFWHKHFFLKPYDPHAYISSWKAKGTSILSEKSTEIKHKYLRLLESGEFQNKIRVDLAKLNFKGNTIYLNNAPVPLQYHKLVAESELRTEYSPADLHEINHELYNEFFLKNHSSSHTTIFVSKPIIGSAASMSETGFEGQGAFFLYLILKPNLSEESKNSIIEVLQDFCRNISVQGGQFTISYLFQAGEELAKKVVQKGRLSTISAILARNFSHNIGSHIMPRITIERIIGRLNWTFAEINGVKLAYVAFLKSKMDKYIQERNEFLANISSEITPSKKNMLLYRDILIPLIENILFFDNIAASENVNYFDDNNDNILNRNRILLRVFIDGDELKVKYPNAKKYNGEIIQYPDNFPYYISGELDGNDPVDIIKSIFNNREIINQNKDVEIEVGGALGEHALYSLLENYIRNTCKHNQVKTDSNDTVEIRLEVSEIDQLHYEVIIRDNISNVTPTTYQRLNNLIQRDFVKIEDGSMYKEGLGISDMKICAMLLSGKQNWPEGSDTSFFQMIPKNDIYTQSSTSVCFRFKLLKPHKLIVFGDKLVSRSLAPLLKKEGITFFKSVSDFRSTAASRFRNYKFAVLDYKVLDVFNSMEKINEFFLLLPFRIIVLTDDLFDNPYVEKLYQAKRIQLLGKDEFRYAADQGRLLKACWEAWISKWVSNEKANINIYLEQQRVESPCKEWILACEQYHSDKINVNIITPGDEKIKDIDDTALQIFYDRHGGSLRGANRKKFTTKDAYIFFDKLSNDFIKIFYPSFPNNSSEDWFFPYELAEAGLLKVLIIDERIAEYSMQRYEDEDSFKLAYCGFGIDGLDSISAFDLAWAANVHICTHFSLGVNEFVPAKPLIESVDRKIKSNHSDQLLSSHFMKMQMNFNEKESCLNYKVKTNFEDSEGKEDLDISFDLIIIHRTKIDELSKRIDSALFLSTLKDKIPFVIVNSGGGSVHSIDGSFKFIPFSVLQNYLLGKRLSKYSFAQSLLSLQKYYYDSK